MIEKATKEELLLSRYLADPLYATKILFSNLNNLTDFNDECSYVRLYQIPYLGFDTVYLEDSSLTDQQNFDIKKGLAERYVFGGRLNGKSLIAVIIDVLLAILNRTFEWAVVCSYDEDHVKQVMEKIILPLEHHPIFRFFNSKNNTQRKPYRITVNKCLLESVNDNVGGRDPGAHHVGKHYDKRYQEESSFLSRIVTNKRKMSISEKGCVNVYSGMTTFNRNSPIGEIFFNKKYKNRIVNTPSYANPTWNKQKEEEAIEEFQGRNSPNYLVQIEGRVIDSMGTALDMDKIYSCILKDKNDNPIAVKHIEITKENYFRYKDILSTLNKPNNVDECIVALDKGEGNAPTEIIIIYKINDKYKYTHNITLRKLGLDEDEELITYIFEKLKANVIGIDATSASGRTVAGHLDNKYPGHVIAVNFNAKIPVNFERDKETGELLRDTEGNPVYKYEHAKTWSIEQIKDIFYSEKVSCYYDVKMINQFNGLQCLPKQMGFEYKPTTEDHLFQAWQVFAILLWNIRFKIIEEIETGNSQSDFSAGNMELI